MTKGLKRCPHVLYADQRLMDKIRRNWQHAFKRGEECWIVDEPRRKLEGPYTFAHYSPASAVILYRHAEGRFTSRRVQFLKDQVLYQTEKEANSILGGLKLLDYIDHQHKADSLIEEIEALLGKRIADIVRNHK